MQIFASFLPALAVGGFLKGHVHEEDATIAVIAKPASTPTSGSPIATPRVGAHVLELRQAPGSAPVNGAPLVDTVAALASSMASAVSSTIDTAPSTQSDMTSTPSIIASAQSVVTSTGSVIISTQSARTTTQPVVTSALLAASSLVGYDYVTTLWIETWLDSTSRTWVPRTVTFHFPEISPAPRPGKGEIGLGTLTGNARKTQTVALGAAPSQTAGWIGIAAAVGVGIVAMAV